MPTPPASQPPSWASSRSCISVTCWWCASARLAAERDGSHAFYLGYELAKAEIAWRLGKRYVQDQPLNWGCAVDRPEEDLSRFKAAGTTLVAKKKARSKR